MQNYLKDTCNKVKDDILVEYLPFSAYNFVFYLAWQAIFDGNFVQKHHWKPVLSV